ncbi:MAG: NPCBM/NEW2 domain-containing protein [Bifidobacteriaceae bacterium]|jgi:hypothetical protein|nr:NPCBM/NEW2 domain-containing protein [Bifidobacteriaceae bacterium]
MTIKATPAPKARRFGFAMSAVLAAAALGVGALSAPAAQAAPKPKAKVTIAVTAKTGIGRFATVRGTVKNSKTGQVVKKAKVTVYRQVGSGGWGKAAVVKTDGRGKYSVKVQVRANTSFKAKAAKTAKRKAGQSAVKTTVVPQKVAVGAVSARSVEAGEKVTIAGQVSSGLAGTRVRVEAYDNPAGTWYPIGSAVARQDGQYSVVAVFTSGGEGIKARVRAPGVASKGISAATGAVSGSFDVYTWRYLSDLGTVAGGGNNASPRTSASVNGTLYTNSVSFGGRNYTTIGLKKYFAYNLGRKCTRMRGTVGINDAAEDGSAVEFKGDVMADDVTVWAQDHVAFGRSYGIDIELRNPLRLEVSATNISVRGDNNALIFGDARVLCVGTP